MHKIQKFNQRFRYYLIYGIILLLNCHACSTYNQHSTYIDFVNPYMRFYEISNETYYPFHEDTSPQALAPARMGVPFGMTHWALQSFINRPLTPLPGKHHFTSIQHPYNVDGSLNFGMESLNHPNYLEDNQRDKPQIASPVHFLGTHQNKIPTLEAYIYDRVSFFRFPFFQPDTATLYFYGSELSPASHLQFYPHSGEIWVKGSQSIMYPDQPLAHTLSSYFLIQTRNPYAEYGTWEDILLQPNETEVNSQGASRGFYLKFVVDAGDVLEVKVGSSHWNIKACRHNLSTQLPDWDFDKLKKTAEASWEKRLSKIQIEVADPSKATENLFYQLLYVVNLGPQKSNDVDGLAPNIFDLSNPLLLEEGDFYANLSRWSSLNDPHPQLLSLLYPKAFKDMKYAYQTIHSQLPPPNLDSDDMPPHPSSPKPYTYASNEIFSILGLRPLAAESKSDLDAGKFQVSIPVVKAWKLKIDDMRSFEVRVSENRYGSKNIAQLRLNGEDITGETLSLEQIHKGGKLEIILD